MKEKIKDFKKSKDTLLNQMNQGINRFSNKSLTTMTGKKSVSFFGFMGLSYYITYMYIAPLFKDFFLIATWGNILGFYLLVLVLGFFISTLYNPLVKILLYFFKG